MSSKTTEQQIAGLGGLPAGHYVFMTTITNDIYLTSTDTLSDDLRCRIRLNGQTVDLGSAHGTGVGVQVPRHATVTEVVALTVPGGSSFTVGCVLDHDAEEDRSLGVGRVVALPVGAVD